MGPDMRESLFLTCLLTWALSGALLAIFALLQHANTPLSVLAVVHLVSLGATYSSNRWRHSRAPPYRSSG